MTGVGIFDLARSLKLSMVINAVKLWTFCSGYLRGSWPILTSEKSVFLFQIWMDRVFYLVTSLKKPTWECFILLPIWRSLLVLFFFIFIFFFPLSRFLEHLFLFSGVLLSDTEIAFVHITPSCFTYKIFFHITFWWLSQVLFLQNLITINVMVI